jgi:hypothetical protein
MKSRKKIIRRMGFIRDQEGIMNRYLRETMNWNQHLENTKEFINNSFNNKCIESVAVLGSGWLLDIPLDAMKDRYKHIFLVDIHHPPQIRKKVEVIKNVELVEADLSGGVIEQIWPIIRRRGIHSVDSMLNEINLTPPLSHHQTDAIISVNLLNQLDIILCEFLEKQGYVHQEPLERFRAEIQSFHLKWITQSPGCLVTDTVEVSLNHDGKESLKSLLYTELPKGHRTGHWSWNFDTHGTYLSGTHTRMEVQAVEWA